ncbi:MAG: ABC transporter ATP-binding protein [Helicobacteraceae bacterium]|jgi:sulfonate transport system ATP-binding protein|nr:ABC transporter ATP-binding protein [Helicobacteraceae bacterium]
MAVEPILQIRNLSKTFELKGADNRVLDRVNLSVDEGEFVSIIGASGCGKSTLLRIIGGLETASGGEVIFEGSAVSKPSRDRGFIFQDHRLLPWLSVIDNIKFSLPPNTPNANEIALEKLAVVGLSGFERRYPRELSGGMSQRAAIARALANSPKLLLLDEPFGALDAITKIRLQEEILRIWNAEKITMILVTHDIDEAVYLGRRVVVMGKGGIDAIHRIELSSPRNRVSAEFARQKSAIYKAFFGDLEAPFTYTI